MMMVFQTRGKVMTVLVWTLMALMLSGAADGHRIFGSFKRGRFGRNSFFKPGMRTQDSSGAPKYMSRAEAEKMYAVRLKQTQESLQAFAPSSGPAPAPGPVPVPLTAPSSVPAPNDTAKAPAPGRIFHVTEYGADPTGASDSTQALMSAIIDAFSLSTEDQLMPGVSDFGGAEIHLQGGNYKLSSPLRLPGGGGGNLLIHGGTLRASENFPKDRYLIELWSPASTKINTSLNSAELVTALQNTVDGNSDQTASYEDITLRDLMLDANFRGGGILVIHSIRTNIDNCYISHFTSEGIMVQRGHETYIRNSFIGQHITAGGSSNERSFSGTGISLLGNDNAVTDVIIFSAAVGIDVTGQANAFIGVHCYNKATGFGGVGIRLRLPGLTQTRILSCYMDYTGIVAEDPVQLEITNSFFLGDGTITLKSGQKKVVKGVNIVDNAFSGGGNGVPIVQLDGSFDTVEQTVVDRNNAYGMSLKSTVARGTVQGNGTTWTVDFSPFLLFPNHIQHVQYSFYNPVESSFPRHALRSVANNKVVVESDVAVPATVAVTVDQSATFVQQGIYS
ncbi:hypothetical protein SUGI_0796770 [Cryptomeria japonica]|uniref:polygalacturonase QRT3 n=1 Tax=Cryptomeria japonica TaxID=3369 RepID=UPI002414906E|nr:polygalacturonase QRT3 [Cryptomeria japonica]GLJ39080.1 hypothetical protein SUGI_0796770 [Cryptomeria japonica]